MWNHKTVIDNLCNSSKTSVDWRSFCSEVTDSWFRDQKVIGGERIEVEIDETLIARLKYKRGRVMKQIWLFGEIKRVSKKRFVVALTSDIAEKRDKATLLPLIQKYVIKGSIIYSDSWGAYTTLSELGYTHFTINHSTNFVHPENRNVHTQNIERLWLDAVPYGRKIMTDRSYLYLAMGQIYIHTSIYFSIFTKKKKYHLMFMKRYKEFQIAW